MRLRPDRNVAESTLAPRVGQGRRRRVRSTRKAAAASKAIQGNLFRAAGIGAGAVTESSEQIANGVGLSLSKSARAQLMDVEAPCGAQRQEL